MLSGFELYPRWVPLKRAEVTLSDGLYNPATTKSDPHLA